MKKVLLGIIFTIAYLTGKSQGLDSLIIEKYYIANQADHDASVDIDVTSGGLDAGAALPIGAVTYRIYADLSKGYKLLGVDGNTSHTLCIKTSTFFYNNSEASAEGTVSWNKNGLVQNVRNLDSYFSMGAASTQANTWGILKSDDNANGGTNLNITGNTLKNNVAEMGLSLTTADGLYTVSPGPSTVSYAAFDDSKTILGDGTANGNMISVGKGTAVISGTWYSLNGVTGPTDDNRILIAQLTTNGILDFQLNLFVQSIVPGSPVIHYVAKTPGKYVGNNEIKLASLTYPEIDKGPIISFNGNLFTQRQPVGLATAIDANVIDPDDNQIDSVLFYINNVRSSKLTSMPFKIDYTTPSASSFAGNDTMTIVKVVAYDADTLYSYKIDTIYTDKTVTLVKSLSTNLKLRVYPNPATNFVTVESDQLLYSQAEITVYSIYGVEITRKLIENAPHISEMINVSNYPSGQYLIEIKTGDVRTTKRFVKM